MKNFRINALRLGVLGLAASVSLGYASSSTHFDTGTTPPTASGAQSLPNSSGPIVINWKIKVGDGKDKVVNGVTYTPVKKPADINLTVNSDGSWNFSGSFPENADHDLDVVVGLKSHEGTLILFRYAGSMSNGVQFNKQGTNETIKDNFASFKPAHWYADYRQPLSSEGVAKMYEKRKERKEKLEVRLKAKDEKAKAEKEREEAREKREIDAEVARQEAARGQAAAPAPSSGGGGGGTSFSSVMGDVTSGISAVGGAVNAIQSIFA